MLRFDGATCVKDRMHFSPAHVLGSSGGPKLKNEFGTIQRVGIAALVDVLCVSKPGPSAHL